MSTKMSAFQNLKETMHARLTTGMRQPPTPRAAGGSNVTSWKGFTFFGEATTIIGQAMKSLVNTVGQTLAMEDFPSDIDGAYITNRILVIGPVRKKLNERDRFRNDYESIKELINDRHGGMGNVLFFDLAPTQSHLDCDALKRAVVQFDLDRPTLEVLREACTAVIGWLDMDEKNVAILTCTNGIKSSCLVAACVYADISQTSVKQGVSRFFEERMKLKKSYVELLQKLPPSYDRLLRRYEKEKNAESLDIPLQLCRLTINHIPFQQGDAQIMGEAKLLIRTGPAFRKVEMMVFNTGSETIEFDVNNGFWRIEFNCPPIVSGDATLDVSIGSSSSDIILFSFPFQVGCFEAGKFKYGPDAMDEVKRHVLPADFQIELVFEEVERLVDDASFAKALLSGKELLSLRHMVKPSKTFVSELMSSYEIEERDAVFALQRTNNDMSRAIALVTKARSSSIDGSFSSSFVNENGDEPSQPLARTKKPALLKVDENSEQINHNRTKKFTSPFTTPAKRKFDFEDEDDPTLSPFLRETIGKGLSSPLTPNDGFGPFQSAVSRNEDDALGEMDKLLLAQLSQLLTADSTLVQKMEKLAVGKATIVVKDSPPAVDAVDRQNLSSEMNVAAPSILLQTGISSENGGSYYGVPTGQQGPSVTTNMSGNVMPVSTKIIENKSNPVVTALECAVKKEEIPPKTVEEQSTEMTLSQHETFGVFFRMLKMGVPRDGVEQKMRRDGFLVKALDLGPNAPVSKLLELEKENQKKVGDDEVYSKYFKMLKMGVPHPAVQQRMVRDGVVPEALDLGEDAPVSKLADLLKNKGAAKMAAASAKKKTVRQKTFRWDAIPEERLQKGVVTIWHNDSGPKEDDLFFTNDLEGLFIRGPEPDVKNPMSKSMSAPKLPVEPSTTRRNSVLDGRRAQSVCIGIAKLKMTGKELGEALISLDEKILTSKTLQVIQGCNLIPNQEETKLLMKQGNNMSDLAQPDEFLLQIATRCPDSMARIEALTFRYLFDEIALSTKDDANRIIVACEQVRNSGKLKDLLRVVLLIGNQINSRGENEDEKIRAFTLASLLKLSQTKSLNKTTTVLEYLVGFLLSKMPHLLNVAEELNAINAVKRIDLVALSKQIRDLKKGLDGIAQTFNGLAQFSDSAYASLQKVESDLTLAKDNFAGVLEYFGEDGGMTSIDFFTTLSSFLVSFAETKKQMEEREKRNARKKSMQQHQQQQQAKKSSLMKQQTIEQNPLPDVIQDEQPIMKKTNSDSSIVDSLAGAVEDVQVNAHPHLAEFLKNL